ncbi:MAG: carboxypeptidase regulatory-like domain-containing protein [Methanolobus sp.]|nr:carboxypeptidase regulatory-like domain-containing protein [Methanolobus sp.]
MKKTRKIFSDDSAIELPINIVVMLVVGMVALAALIAIIPPPTKNMAVAIDTVGLNGSTLNPGNTVIVASATANSPFAIDVELSVTDPDGYPVRDANVVLRGLGGVATSVTDDIGYCKLTTSSTANGDEVSLGANQNEGSMDLTISADGFYDYEKTDSVRIIRTT